MISKSLSEADQAFRSGRISEAEILCQSILDAEPRNLSALLMVGIILGRTDRSQEAIPYFEEAALQNAWEAYLWLSRCYRKLGAYSEAVHFAEKGVERSPQNAPMLHQLGISLMEMNRFEDAIPTFRRAILYDSNSATLFHGLGLALKAASRNTEAIQALRRAAELSPNAPMILVSLFEALIEESETTEAVRYARIILKLQPNPDSYLRLAKALVADGKPIEARSALSESKKEKNPSGQFIFSIGSIHQMLGENREAGEWFERSIEVEPLQGSAYGALAYSRKTQPSHLPIVQKMEEISQSESLSTWERSLLNFALGKSREDLSQFEAAMLHFDQANRLAYEFKFGERIFDSKSYATRIDLAISNGMVRIEGPSTTLPSDSTLPIFVIGMIRSGTTLVEQILSSHVEIGSGGEQGFWLHNRESALTSKGEIDDSNLKKLSEAYLERLAKIAPGMSRVVDKMPDNYFEVPLIHRALPKAKFIHCKRNPADTCISIYTTINRLAIEWGNNRENIVAAYRQYQRVMEAWKELLPQDSTLEVAYEDLVTDRERVTREMVAFCGLEWDENCLHPEQNQRGVATPSVWQVRQPIYTSSIGRWKNYEPWLGAFSKLV